MKVALKIAKAELNTLFYSPIAWLLAIVFLFQCGLTYTEGLQQYLMYQDLGGPYLSALKNMTHLIFTPPAGMFNTVGQKIYLYIPLLTMGLISREISSGTIKLLYSSPIKISQMVLGKFMAMMGYNFLLILIMLCFVIAGMFNIQSADLGLLLSSLLGIYLLLCAYSAIGLFMSSLTSYQIVAALCTLVVFAALSYIGTIWQDIDFVRDLTFFLSISGRTGRMLLGLISTKDVIYFALIIYIFLGFCIVRLQSQRESKPAVVVAGKYVFIFISALTAGYITSLPTLVGYYDATVGRQMTLTPNSQKIIKELGDEPLEVTSYINLLDSYYWQGKPDQRNIDLNRWLPYMRFKSDIKLKYVYYYDAPLMRGQTHNGRMHAGNMAAASRQTDNLPVVGAPALHKHHTKKISPAEVAVMQQAAMASRNATRSKMHVVTKMMGGIAVRVAVLDSVPETQAAAPADSSKAFIAKTGRQQAAKGNKTTKDNLVAKANTTPTAKNNAAVMQDQAGTFDTPETILSGSALKKAADNYAKSFKVDLSDFKTPAEIRKIIDLRPEHNRYVMQLKFKGKTTFLRLFDDSQLYPSETETDAALKRLISKLPKIAFLQGEYERSKDKLSDKEYGQLTSLITFRISLVNQGFDVENISLQNGEIPSGISALVIADPKMPFSPAVINKVKQYIAKGGNLLLAGEPGKQAILNPILSTLGVQMMDGELVQHAGDEPSDRLKPLFTQNITDINKKLQRPFKDSIGVSMPGVSGLTYTNNGPFLIKPLLMSDANLNWNKKGKLVLDSADVAFSSADGDTQGAVPTMLALTRQINHKEQRIIIAGDADFLANKELFKGGSANFLLGLDVFGWFANGQFPIDTDRPEPKDRHVNLTGKGLSMLKVLFLGVLPGLLTIFAAVFLIRRKRK